MGLHMKSRSEGKAPFRRVVLATLCSSSWHDMLAGMVPSGCTSSLVLWDAISTKAPTRLAVRRSVSARLKSPYQPNLSCTTRDGAI